MLIHHTECGMQSLTDDGFRAELQEATGVAPAFAIESFAESRPTCANRCCASVNPVPAHRDKVRGFVYDVDTLRLREIELGDADIHHAG